MDRVSWAIARIGLAWLVVLAACGGDSTSRDDAGATPLPPPPPDASADRSAPPIPRDAGSVPDTGPCPAGETDCNGVCTNLQHDPASCGACGRACRDGDACVRGECVCEGDGPGVMACTGSDGRCEVVDTLNSREDCGSCDNVCAAGMICAGGECRCPDGLLLCDGECIDPQSDNQNCGACGVVCRFADARCTSSVSCSAGACVDTCDPLCPCPSGCADLDSDPNNCGGCGDVVLPGRVCIDGVGMCPPGTLPCEGGCVPVGGPPCIGIDAGSP